MLSVSRIGDLEAVHCSVPARAVGNPNVIVSGSPWSCVGDINIPHLLPAGITCVIHTAPMYTGSSKVFVGGRAAGRISSTTCTFVVQGSPNVFCV